ncbi:MAG: TlpA disulfide reductase family protein [Bacteroidales bacterium]
MNRFILIFILASCLIPAPLLAKPVVFSGKSPEYAGQELILCAYQNYITLTESELGRTVPGKDGSFTLTIDLANTRLVFFHLGKTMAYLYAQPGMRYSIVLPPRRDLDQGDLLNPYFREDEIMLGIADADTNSLNAVIARFDDAYGPIYANYAMDFYDRNNYKQVDSTISVLTKQFEVYSNPYFRHYLYYKTGMLRNTAWQFKARTISTPYFSGNPVCPTDPVYMELFLRVFDSYFQYFDRTRKKSEINDIILHEKSYRKLDNLLRQDSTLINDSLRCLVILKNIHDEFYGMTYPRSALLTILDSLISSSPIPDMQHTGKLIREKVVRLLPGFEPPAFELLNKDGKKVKLSDLRGKYIYMGFCNCFSYSCMKEYEMLNRLQEKHADRLTILTISVDPSLKKMQDFLTQNGYAWTFLHYGDQISILREYDIRAFPTYFVIGPDGKLLLSPAPGPGENIESYLFQLMRSRGDL